MDDRALKVEEVKMDLAGFQYNLDLTAKRHMLVLGIAMTGGLTAAYGALSAQVSPEAAGACLAVAAGVVLAQLRGLAKLSALWRNRVEDGRRTIQKLMQLEDDSDVDDSEEA